MPICHRSYSSLGSVERVFKRRYQVLAPTCPWIRYLHICNVTGLRIRHETEKWRARNYQHSKTVLSKDENSSSRKRSPSTSVTEWLKWIETLTSCAYGILLTSFERSGSVCRR